MFHFLNPTMLFALSAALIPLFIHLFNRRKFKEIQFSTIHFLKEMVRKEMRRLRLRQLLLLLIRTLIIMMIVLAFSRPTLHSSANFATGRSSTEVVFIIDNSLSLNSLQLTGSLLENIKQWWVNLEPMFQVNDRISVLLATEPMKILVEREYYSSELWKKATKNIQPQLFKGNFQLATLKAVEMLRKSDLPNKELFYISDFQMSGINEHELSSLWQELPKNTRVYFLPVFHSQEENVSVDSVLIMNQLLEKNQPMQVKVFLTNQTKNRPLNSMISLIVQGSRLTQQNVAIAPLETKLLQLEIISQFSGYQVGFVECENDALLEDNRYYFNVFIPEQIKILHLLPHLQFQSFIPTILQAARDKNLFIYERKTLSDWPTINLDEYDAIIIEGFTNFVEGFTNRLRQYHQNQKGLILIPGDNLAIQNVSDFLNDLQLGKIISLQGDPEKSEEFVSFGRINWAHPIFEGLFAEKKELNPVHMYAYYRMQPHGNSEVIIEYQNGHPFLVQKSKEGGPLFLLTAPLQPQWTNLVIRGLVVPLVYRMIYYAVTQPVTQRLQITVGEKLKQVLREISPPYQFLLKKPSGLEEKITPAFRGSDLYLEIDQNDEIGNYQLWNSEKLLFVYSVNHPPQESIQQYYGRDAIHKIFPDGIWIDPAQDVHAEIEKSRFGVELWSYFLIAAIILLFCEMVISYTASRKQKELWTPELKAELN